MRDTTGNDFLKETTSTILRKKDENNLLYNPNNSIILISSSTISLKNTLNNNTFYTNKVSCNNLVTNIGRLPIENLRIIQRDVVRRRWRNFQNAFLRICNSNDSAQKYQRTVTKAAGISLATRRTGWDDTKWLTVRTVARYVLTIWMFASVISRTVGAVPSTTIAATTTSTTTTSINVKSSTTAVIDENTMTISELTRDTKNEIMDKEPETQTTGELISSSSIPLWRLVYVFRSMKKKIVHLMSNSRRVAILNTNTLNRTHNKEFNKDTVFHATTTSTLTSETDSGSVHGSIEHTNANFTVTNITQVNDIAIAHSTKDNSKIHHLLSLSLNSSIEAVAVEVDYIKYDYIGDDVGETSEQLCSLSDDILVVENARLEEDRLWADSFSTPYSRSLPFSNLDEAASETAGVVAMQAESTPTQDMSTDVVVDQNGSFDMASSSTGSVAMEFASSTQGNDNKDKSSSSRPLLRNDYERNDDGSDDDDDDGDKDVDDDNIDDVETFIFDTLSSRHQQSHQKYEQQLHQSQQAQLLPESRKFKKNKTNKIKPNDQSRNNEQQRQNRFLEQISILSSALLRSEFDASVMLPTERLRQLRSHIRNLSLMMPTQPLPSKQQQQHSPQEASQRFTRVNEAEEQESSKITEKELNTKSFDKINKDVLSDEEELLLLDAITPQSDLSLPGRFIHIVTTASLPWFTGTAVNPLLRAAYLHRRTKDINSQHERKIQQQQQQQQRQPATDNTQDNDIHVVLPPEQQQQFTHSINSVEPNRMKKPKSYVTLVIPWLELPEDQSELYSRIFESPADQEAYVRDWLRHQAQLPDAAAELGILFYPARYHSGLGSIFAMGDIMDVIPASNRDVCVLEEPEHCNWFRAPGDGWTKQFNYVVGVIHTNYKEYAQSHYSGLWAAPALHLMSSAMVRAYCHKVIKLSSVLQSYAPEKEITSNVHGVRSEFIEAGLQHSTRELARSTATTKKDTELEQQFSNQSNSQNMATEVYFIGKLLWAKGLDIMLELEDYYKQCTGKYFSIDIYGSGPDQKAIMRAFHGLRTFQKKEYDGNGEENVKTTIGSPSKKRLRNSSNNNNNNNSVGNYRNEDDEDDSTSNGMFHINSLGLKLSLGSGRALDKMENWNFFDGNNNDDDSITLTTGSSDTIPAALENFQLKAKEKIAKLKQSINSVEIPKSFSELRRQPIPANFPGRVDHASLKDKYKIFINPSVSEVLCTTTAEALAMGKFAIIPDHPSNKFFLQFPNCLAYRTKYEFVANLRWALTHDVEPLTEEQIKQFTWDAATDRFLAASAVTYREALERERLGLHKLDERIAWFHNELGKGEKGDMIRKILGGGPVSYQVKYQKSIHSKQKKDHQHHTTEGSVLSTSTKTEILSDSEMIALRKSLTSEKDDEEHVKDDNEDGQTDDWNSKFRRSSFAQVLRAALSELSSTMMIL